MFLLCFWNCASVGFTSVFCRWLLHWHFWSVFSAPWGIISRWNVAALFHVLWRRWNRQRLEIHFSEFCPFSSIDHHFALPSMSSGRNIFSSWTHEACIMHHLASCISVMALSAFVTGGWNPRLGAVCCPPQVQQRAATVTGSVGISCWGTQWEEQEKPPLGSPADRCVYLRSSLLGMKKETAFLCFQGPESVRIKSPVEEERQENLCFHFNFIDLVSFSYL